ncbi:MAG TPA: bifunctional diguanylate cyclase/phosphodiesterase [Vicinamibacterales bacterium]|jgi:EAL domain-containing protein (putative c-di-GMP-specific phosphodiesterase class I)/GGDEF domain-containing protein|nr:bifunctional diguanylate cyclase/phosphodiesterase [Vicinamibacterales bacterium]
MDSGLRPPDRDLLAQRLTRSIERARRYPGFHYAILSIDLGLGAGGDAVLSADDEAVLAAAVRRLEACLRVSDLPPTLRHGDLVVHVHDAEVAVLLDGLKEVGHAVIAAERILAELWLPFGHPAGEVRLSASIGIAVSASGYERPEDALRDADMAMQRARHLGGGCCEVFDRAALQAAQTELRLEADFAGALERGEFALVYQPIASLASNRIAGFEALVRWNHPGLGLIAPLEFIPLAEKTGFIVPLGAWVLREACRQLKTWQSTIPGSADLWMSVNLSSLQFRSATLVDDITQVLTDCGIEARSLVLELTEGIAMENPVAVRALLLQLRAIGVRVSVDDFGTGHSSLAYLRQFPLHSLKVDRSFVRGIEGNRDMASIVSAVTTMAQQLGLRVVAEGIEKEEQLGLLRALGCEFGQGYLFSRPIDPEAAASLLTAGLPARQGAPLGDAAAAMLASLAPAPHLASRQRRTTAIRWLYVAAAAVILPLAAGLPGQFRNAGSTGDPATAVASGAALTRDVPLPAPPLAEVAAPLPPTRSAVPSSARVAVPSAGPAVPAAGPAVAVARKDTAAPAVPGISAAVTPVSVTSLRVVHQHRLGSCRGQFVVSRDGVAYIPEDATQGKDGFRLKYTEFLNEWSGDNLRITSNQRDYRFRVAEPSAHEHEQLERVAAAIARFR